MILAVHWPVSFEQPQWLGLLAIIPLLVLVSLRTLRGLERPRRITALVLRSLVIALIAIALARVQIVRRNEHVAVMFVLDRSNSVPEKLRESAQDYVRKVVEDADPDDRVGMVGFDGEADIDMIPSRGGFSVLGFGMAVEPDRTNVAAGLRMAMAAFPEGFSRRIVIITDGNQNDGDVTREIETAIANNVAVDVVPLRYDHDQEMLFDRISVPAHAKQDTKVPVRLLVKSKKRGRAKLELYHNDEPVPLNDPYIDLTGGMKPDPFTIPIELHAGGVHRFDARLNPMPQSADSIGENNVATAFTFVEAQGRVLLLTQPRSTEDQVLYESLLREKVEVEMLGVDQVSIDLLKLQEYSVVILSNVSADIFTREQHEALAAYVRDFGGGLIMTGGDESFGAGGWIGSPVEEVSPVAFDIKQKRVDLRGALAIVMHSCEIPRGNEWGEKVAVAAVSTISSLDYVGVICYSYRTGGPNWDVPLNVASDKAAIVRKIKQMQIGDMPDFASTMEIAVTGLMNLTDVSQRHMIIISDGDPTGPAQRTINRMVANQITCSTVGIGYGSHVIEPPLRQIASDTGGRFYPCKNPVQLPQIFIKEAKTIKRPLLDHNPFQPRLAFPDPQTTLGFKPEDLPPLGGLVLTRKKPDAFFPIIRTTTDDEDPVLGYWNYEMGKMAAFTSGWWQHWGTDWASWEKFGKFWAQIIGWAMRQSGSADFDIVTRLDGDKGRVVIEVLNKDASYLNFLRINGKLMTPSMESQPLYLAQTGPGQYEATFDVSENGNYLVNLRYGGGSEGDSGMIRTGLSVPYSPEFRELGTNMPLLEQVAEKTRGRMLGMNPETDDVFSRESLPPAVAKQPLWRWIVAWLLLPAFLLDVAARRLASTLAMSVYVEVAVFATACAALYTAQSPPWGYVGALILAELVGWTIRWKYILPTLHFFTGTVRGLARAGERSTASLSQLKEVRDKVRGEMETDAARKQAGTLELEPVADPRRRYEVDEKTAAKPVGDLTESVGGAVASELEAETPGKRPKPGQKPADDVTSRLLRAKKRARDEMKNREENP